MTDRPMIDPARLDQYLIESLTEKLNEIEYTLGLDYTDTEGHIVVIRHRKGRPDVTVLSQSFLVPRPPDIDELEQENKLLRARNERLEKEMLSYTVGWNNALDASAARLVHYFKGAFGDDTCASWALWLKSQRLPEDSK